MNIHPTAIVSAEAKIAEDAEIGPYAVIEEDVQIGRRVKIYARVHIFSHTVIGDDSQIHPGAILGGPPQIRGKVNPTGRLITGQRNVFREYVTVHRSSQDGEATVIGADNYFMAFSHIAHDCRIGDHVTICNGALIAGHVLIEDYAFISGNVTVHQFCRIGKLSMVGGLARVAKDVPPYMLVKGDSVVWAVNSVGLKRANFSLPLRNEIKRAFKLLYKSGFNVRQASEQMQRQNNSPEIRHLINFVQLSRRGICGHKSPAFWERIYLSIPFLGQKPAAVYRLFQSKQISSKC